MDSDSVLADSNLALTDLASGLREWGPKLMESDAELISTDMPAFKEQGKGGK